MHARTPPAPGRRPRSHPIASGAFAVALLLLLHPPVAVAQDEPDSPPEETPPADTPEPEAEPELLSLGKVLEAAYEAKSAKRWDDARAGFHEYLDRSTSEGKMWQVRMDLAYVEKAAGNLFEAREAFATIRDKSTRSADRSRAAAEVDDLLDKPRHDAAAMIARAADDPDLCAPAQRLFEEAELIHKDAGVGLAPLYLDRAYLHWSCYQEEDFWTYLALAEELGDATIKATVAAERTSRTPAAPVPEEERRLLTAESLDWVWRDVDLPPQLPAARPLPEGTAEPDISRTRTFQLLKTAWRLKGEKQYALAEWYFRRALAKEPDRERQVHGELAYIALALGEYDDAHLWFRSVAHGSSDAAAARAELELLALGGIALENKEYDKAIAWGQPRQKVELTRAYEAMAAEDVAEAKRWFRAAATIPEGGEETVDWYWLREANEQLVPLLTPRERRDWVRTDVDTRPPEEATEAPPMKGWSGAELLDEAKRLLAARKLGLARLVFEKAGARRADETEVALGLGQIALIKRDLDEAQAQFDIAAESTRPLTATAAQAELAAMAGRWMFIGGRFAEADMPDEAVDAYEKARAAGHPADQVDLSLAYLKAATGQEAEARALFAALVESEDEQLATTALAEMEIRTPLWVQAAMEELDAGHIPAATRAFLNAPPAEELGPWSLRQLGGVTGCLLQDTDTDEERAYKEDVCPKDAPGLLEYTVQRMIVQHLLNVGANRDVALATLREVRDERVDPQSERARQTIKLAAVAWLGQAQMKATEARRSRSDDDLKDSVKFYELARSIGAESQQIDLELGWLHKYLGEFDDARVYFKAARDDGYDEEKSRVARSELRTLTRLFWGDVYAEGYGWHRFAPTPTTTNFVPLLRVRGYIHPVPTLDLDPYVYFRISRDFASRASDPLTGFPVILADNTMSFGVGVQFRFWERRVAIWAQLGPVFHLVPRIDRPRAELEARAGIALGLEAPSCHPAALRKGAKLIFEPCADVYGSAVWIGRSGTQFLPSRHNVYFFVRGRVGFHYLVTGPVGWGPFVEARLLADVNGDYYNNLADFGVGHRWRLLEPFGLDLLLGIHAGSYLGRQNRDPAPTPLTYAELRLLLVTYIKF